MWASCGKVRLSSQARYPPGRLPAVGLMRHTQQRERLQVLNALKTCRKWPEKENSDVTRLNNTNCLGMWEMQETGGKSKASVELVELSFLDSATRRRHLDPSTWGF